MKPGRTHRGTGQGQDGVDPHGAQQGALARHVRAAHDQHPRRLAERDVVANADRRRQQRVADRFGLEASGALDELGKRVGRVFGRVRGHRAEGFKLTDRLEPVADPRRPDRARQASIRSASWIVQSQRNARGMKSWFRW